MLQNPRLTPQEWCWALRWSAAVLALSCLPYLIVWWLAPEGWHFAGIMVNPYDGHSYLAKMQQGSAGQWLFHLSYTPDPHEGAFIFVFYLGLGQVAALTGLPLIWMFHLARLAAGFFLLVTAFHFIGHVTPAPTERRLAFVFLLTASGLGWLGVIFGAFPIDLWVPEAFVPYSLYANPHFPLGMALMLLIIRRVAWPDGVKNRQQRADTHRSASSHSDGAVQSAISNLPVPTAFLSTGLAALALALVLPFALLTVWSVLALYLAWLYITSRRLPWMQIWLTLCVGLMSAPVIGYDYWVSTTHPILIGWAAQNITTAPAWFNLLLGYGLIGPLAIVGAWITIRSGQDTQGRGEWLVLLWAVTTVILVYLPFNLQRRLINGLHIPLCILAAIGLARWLAQSGLGLRLRGLVTTGTIALGLIGTLFVWSLPILGSLQSPAESETAALFFLREEEIIALDWLRESSTPDAVVLASPRLGLFVPSQTGLRVFYGHPFETVDAAARQEMAIAFYRGDIEAVSPPVDLIIYGPSEQALGEPEQLANYPVLFQADGLSIYETTP